MSERIFVGALLVAIGIVAFQQYNANRFPPPPSVFVGVALIYTVLAVVAVAAPGIAAGFAVAADLGLVLRPGAGVVPGTVVPGQQSFGAGPSSGGSAQGPATRGTAVGLKSF